MQIIICLFTVLSFKPDIKGNQSKKKASQALLTGKESMIDPSSLFSVNLQCSFFKKKKNPHQKDT